MATVTVSRAGDRLVALKRCDMAGGEALRREAAILERLDHPGLVQLVDLVEADDGVTMQTLFVGADTWESRPPGPAERAAGLAAIAATIADLHELGVTHGALGPDHVLVAADGRPVLCGLGRSAPASTERLRADTVSLADLADPDAGPAPPDGSADAASALRSLAARVRAGRLDARGVAREADAISAGSDAAHRRASRGSRRLAVPAAIVLTVVAVVASAIIAARPGASPAVARAVPTEPGGPDRDVHLAPAGSIASTPEPPASTDLVSAVERPGAIVERAGRRYAIGRPGDLVVVGDWRCDGSPTPVIVRPATGEVVAFDAWPDPGGSITAEAAWTVAEPIVAAELDTATACDRVRIRTAAGSRLIDPAAS